ncbi:FadR/GntR family transcriptional regulator [Nocardioides ultimimeridianus]
MKPEDLMPLAPAATASLVDQAIDRMRGLLDSGEWAVGARIPPEPALAAALAVSRNTVREAVKALAHLGLLQVRRGDGTYVVATTEVQALMRRQLDRVEIGHLLEVRHMIEVSAAGLAAQRRTDADLGAMEAILARREAVVGEEFVRADVDFHAAVVAAAHNPLLSELYAGLVGTVAASIDPDVRDHLTAEHVAVAAAIRAGDPAAASAAAEVLLDHVVY